MMVSRKNQSINVPEVFQEVKDGGEPEMLYAALTVGIDGEPQVLGPTLHTPARLKGECHEMNIFSCQSNNYLFPLFSLKFFSLGFLGYSSSETVVTSRR